ncbi:MAG TPA: hypothetical protein VGI19_16875 [Candidatus Cybelea sp.]|jgi:hypothetical protein
MNRRVFLAGSATVAATTSAASAATVPGGEHFVVRLADFDEASFAAIVGRPAQIRQVYEAVGFQPGVLGSIKNSLNGLQFGFGYPAASLAVALAAHGPSSAFSFSDYLWTKYRIGDFFALKDADGRPLRANVFLKNSAPYDPSVDPDDEKGMYQDASLEMLQRRGTVVLTCHTAVEEIARRLVHRGYSGTGQNAQDVADDILSHLIAGAVVVPSMVATLAVLQTTYRYVYTSGT